LSACSYLYSALSSLIARLVLHHLVLPFDYVVIGTGSRYPSNIKPKESSLSFRREQFKQERKELSEASKVLVVGGGVVGTEMAGEIMSYFPDVPVELVTRNHCLLPRSRGAHELATSVLQNPKLQTPVAISYNESIDLSDVDHDRNFVQTSKGRDISLDGTKVVNCTGYTPNSNFLPRRWLDEKGFIVCTAQMEIEAKAVPRALRTSPGSRFYFAMGDV
jgi:pyruvate/2-oxoglutarate dehydrogenase complex dihydrolipoamide dehydrogenase (E3) component